MRQKNPGRLSLMEYETYPDDIHSQEPYHGTLFEITTDQFFIVGDEESVQE
jgi:hypothetical protein